MIILDTSGLLAALDGSERHHSQCLDCLNKVGSGPRILSPFVLAELDYLLGKKIGVEAQEALLQEVSKGTYQLASFDQADVAQARKHLKRFADFGIGIADASLIVLAERYETRDILTLDERHFRTLTDSKKRHFRLLPVDR